MRKKELAIGASGLLCLALIAWTFAPALKVLVFPQDAIAFETVRVGMAVRDVEGQLGRASKAARDERQLHSLVRGDCELPPFNGAYALVYPGAEGSELVLYFDKRDMVIRIVHCTG